MAPSASEAKTWCDEVYRICLDMNDTPANMSLIHNQHRHALLHHLGHHVAEDNGLDAEHRQEMENELVIGRPDCLVQQMHQSPDGLHGPDGQRQRLILAPPASE